MKRVRDPQTARPTILETPGDLQHRRFLTGQHHRRRPVHRRDRHPIGQQRRDLVLGRLHRHHRPTGRQRLHQPSPRGHQSTRVLQRQHTRHVGGRDLTDRMPTDEVRPHTKGLHQPEQRHLDREQRGLSRPCAVQGLRIITPHHPPHRIVQVCEYGVQRLREHREPAIQLPAHTQPLRTLPREHHSQRPVPDNTTRNLIHTTGIRIRQQHRPVLERGPARRQRKPDIQRTTAVRSGGEPLHLGIQSDGRPPRHHPRHHARHHRRLLDPLLRRRRLLHDHVRVGAADSERRHSGSPGTSRLGPRGVLRQQLDRTGRPVHIGGGQLGVQAARQLPVPQGHHRLDQARYPGGALGVADVGLHRPQQQRAFALLPVRGQQGLRLDGVAEGGAGAVRLHRVHLIRGEVGAVQGGPDHSLLRGAVRGAQAVGGAVLVDRGAAHHGEHGVSVAPGVRQPLQDQHPGALAPADSVGRVGEGLAAPVGGQPALRGERDEDAGRGHHGRTTGQRQSALARPQ